MGELYERGRFPAGAELETEPEAAPDVEGPEDENDAEDAETGTDIIGAARGAAVAILLMLAFGCVIGAAFGKGGVTSLARAIVISVAPHSATTVASTPTPSPDTGNTGGGGGGASSSGGGRGGGAAPVQQTVTVDESTTPDATTTTSSTSSPDTILGLPPIKHVWEIVLSEQGYTQSFGDAANDPYLATTLRARAS